MGDENEVVILLLELGIWEREREKSITLRLETEEARSDCTEALRPLG